MREHRSSKFDFPVIAKAAKVYEDKQSGMVIYGENNLLPQEILDSISTSGTATECNSKISTFVEADGFNDKNFAKRYANPGQTWDELLSEISANISMFEGVYFNVQYNMAGEPQDIYIVPFDEVRLTTGGDFLVNKKWKNKQTTEAIKYPAFDPSLKPAEILNIISAQMEKHKGKQLGFILMVYRKKLKPKHYPLPDFYAGFEDIESDAALQVLERRNIKKGFKTDVIISTLGYIDKQKKDDTGKTAYDYFVDILKKFTSEDAPGVLHLEGGTEDSMPQVKTFPLKDLLNGIDLARERVAKSVCRHFGVPPILVLGNMPEGWGNTQALVNSMKLFNRNILRYQNMISNSIKKFYPGEPTLDTSISTLNLADYIPTEVFPDLTQDERRGIAGYKPLSNTGVTAEKSLAEKIGMGGVTALSGIVSNPDLNDEQKVQFIVKVFALPLEDANSIVYGNPNGPTQEGGGNGN